MFLLVQALLACVPVEPAPVSPRPSRLSDTLEVEVNPGVNGGTWRATLRPLRPGEDPDARDPLPADTCVGTTAAPPPARATLPTRWTSVETEGALAGRWSRAGNGWTGNGTVRDPAWAVADLVLHTADAPRAVVTGAIRLGPTPAVTSVQRTPEGGARIAWDPRTVDVVRVRTRGPAGTMVCGARADGATLPWWAAPPRGGHLQVESTRQRVVRLEDGTLRLVRTVVVQDVAMDAPRSAREEDERVAVPVRRPAVPRRPQVRARGGSGTG